MQVLGQYVGLGEGDSSDEIVKIKAHLKKKFTPARNTLDDGPLFTPAMTVEVRREQDVFVADGRLKASERVPGVINLAMKYAMGYLSKEVMLPLYFSTEGHMSDMWVGPVAWIGSVLAAEGRALHFPTSYNRTKLPFDNKSGVLELARRVGATVQDNGVKFPPGTPFGMGSFSQGAMIQTEFYKQYLMPGKPLNWRLKDLRFVISCGNPDREKGVCATWITDPPAADHQGIMDDADRMVNTPWWWLEIARAGDAYTDNQSSGERARNKTAIAKIITQNKWSGGPAGLLARLGDLITGPFDDLVPIALSLYDMIRFASNMGVHGTYDLDPAVQFARERLAAAA